MANITKFVDLNGLSIVVDKIQENKQEIDELKKEFNVLKDIIEDRCDYDVLREIAEYVCSHPVESSNIKISGSKSNRSNLNILKSDVFDDILIKNTILL